MKSSSSSFLSSSHACGELQDEPLTGITTIQMVDKLYLYTGDAVHLILSFSSPV